MTKIRMLLTVLRRDAGATSIEYALIASLISIVIVAAATTVGLSLIDLYDKVASFWK